MSKVDHEAWSNHICDIICYQQHNFCLLHCLNCNVSNQSMMNPKTQHKYISISHAKQKEIHWNLEQKYILFGNKNKQNKNKRHIRSTKLYFMKFFTKLWNFVVYFLFLLLRFFFSDNFIDLWMLKTADLVRILFWGFESIYS